MYIYIIYIYMYIHISFEVFFFSASSSSLSRPPDGPVPRAYHSAVHWRKTGALVLFGGVTRPGTVPWPEILGVLMGQIIWK